MNIQNNLNSRIKFGSKNHPIKPFKINNLKFEEMHKSDNNEVSDYFFKSSMDNLPSWKEYYKDASSKDLEFVKMILKQDIIDTHNKKDGNSTILVGKNPFGKIKSLFIMHHFDELHKFKDLKTGYIEECAINGKYRNQGIGSFILKKLLETANGHFTDIFLEANNEAVNFYSRLGFKPLDLSNPHIKKFSEIMLNHRVDRNYITLMSKSIDNKNPWWKRFKLK